MELMKRKVLLFLFVAMAILAAMVTPTASQCLSKGTLCSSISLPCCSPYSCKLFGVNRACQ
ncbi:hypothetical protein COLO4_02945 [Corchorus olitorius]|uniref:Uncharacterized protein n=1 Tax=Corchorus olitorius TaxID=93759 RepID=A0A1R3KZV0_9ROSI|nr:hypothetical protein COLO4_02945 [Corchorus olitorius]